VQARASRTSDAAEHGQPRDPPHALREPQDPAEALTDARARLAKVWADLDEDAHRREAALPFRLPGPRRALHQHLPGRCAALACAACAGVRLCAARCRVGVAARALAGVESPARTLARCRRTRMAACWAGRHLPSKRANRGVLVLIGASRRVAAPAVRWDDGRLSVRFPLRRGADVAAVLGELTAQLGGGAAAGGGGGDCSVKVQAPLSLSLHTGVKEQTCTKARMKLVDEGACIHPGVVAARRQAASRRCSCNRTGRFLEHQRTLTARWW